MKTEREIVEELNVGKVSAFDTLYESYSQNLFNFAFSILKSKEDAREVVQITYFKIWEKRKNIDCNQSFKFFLFSIAYHVTVDILRERLNERKYRKIILEKASVNYNLEEAIEFGDLLNHIGKIVKELPPRKHEIYKLNREDHLSYREIAEKLNISVKTVENSLNFSMNFIKTRLGSDFLAVLCITTLFL